MEVISKHSRITTAKDSASVVIPDSTVSFSTHFFTDIQPSTPPTSFSRDLHFSIPPSMTSEIFLKNCDLIVEWKITNEDSSVLTKNQQISIANFFGVMCWSRITTLIGNYMPPFFKNLHICTYIVVFILYIS